MGISYEDSLRDSAPLLISVVVCTYNRANLLASALQALSKQSLSPSEYEIIIVDNNSNDETRPVSEEFCQRHPNVRYCFEAKQGLSHARNRGWREARGEYVGYTDDDCRVPEEWLALAKEVIDQVSPGVFGGPYYAFYDGPTPRWYKDSYGSHEQGNEARVLAEHEYLDGGNIFFRRSLLQSLGGFDVKLGMCGQEIGFGEETALLRRIRATMPEQAIYYEPRLYVYHLVHAKKMSLPWLISQRFRDGRYAYRVFQANDNPPEVAPPQFLTGILMTLMRFAHDLAYGILSRDRSQYPYIQNYLYERALRNLQTLGRIYEQYQQVKQGDRT